jgi:hypothetical protein
MVAMSESTQSARGAALGIGRAAIADGEVHAETTAITVMVRPA